MNLYKTEVPAEGKGAVRFAGKPMLPNGAMVFLDLLLVVVSILWIYVTPSLDGGALGWMTAGVVIPAFLVLVLLAILGCRNHWLERWFNYLSLLIMTLPVAKTVADILWNMNHALLR